MKRDFIFWEDDYIKSAPFMYKSLLEDLILKFHKI